MLHDCAKYALVQMDGNWETLEEDRGAMHAELFEMDAATSDGSAQ
jgi:hypothetical protein